MEKLRNLTYEGNGKSQDEACKRGIHGTSKEHEQGRRERNEGTHEVDSHR